MDKLHANDSESSGGSAGRKEGGVSAENESVAYDANAKNTNVTNDSKRHRPNGTVSCDLLNDTFDVSNEFLAKRQKKKMRSRGDSTEGDEEVVKVGTVFNSNKGTASNKSKSNDQLQQLGQQRELPKFKQHRNTRKRPRKCPFKDSILIDVPIHVTADLGLAVRRTRKNRTKRIQRWVANVTGVTSAIDVASNKNVEINKKQQKGGVTPNSDKLEGNNGSDGEECSGDNGNIRNSSQDMEEDEEGVQGGVPCRDQYGSVLDYLEAKYVRGVMIADYDEERAKKARKSKGKGKGKKGDDRDFDSEKIGDESDDDDRRGSCYEDSDGDFLDDSLLHEEVKDQVLASSTFGRTKIEDEAQQRKRLKKQKMSEEGANESEKAETQVDENGGSDGHPDEYVVPDFDDGFFVNVGDLEMVEGWNGDEDHFVAPSKTARKRVRVENGRKKSREVIDLKKKKKKYIMTPDLGKNDMKQSAKKKKVTAKHFLDNKIVKKTKQNSISGTPVNKNKASKENTQSANKQTTTKKKKVVTKENQTRGKKVKQEKPNKVMSTDVRDNEIVEQPLSPRLKEKRPKTPRAKATQLNKLVKRKFNVCVKMIKELTSAELPRKQKSKSTIRVSVNIPPDKSIGDDITFTNPNVPGQKLKVRIPDKADMKKRSFVVSVPAGKANSDEVKENNFPKELKEALFEYSNAYDDWCTAEAEFYDSLPLSKVQIKFKPTTERLKKFDEMIKEFPTNLATPVDVSYLRLIVRRVRSNKAKVQARKEVTPVEAKPGFTTVEIRVPKKGTDFSFVSFNKISFE